MFSVGPTEFSGFRWEGRSCAWVIGLDSWVIMLACGVREGGSYFAFLISAVLVVNVWDGFIDR